MIIWFQQLAPTNITWYHKTQDKSSQHSQTHPHLCNGPTQLRWNNHLELIHPWFSVGIKTFKSSCCELPTWKKEGRVRFGEVATETTSQHSMGWAGQSTCICHLYLFGKECSASQIPQPPVHCHCLFCWCKCLWGCSMKWARESIQVKNDHASPSPSPSLPVLEYYFTPGSLFYFCLMVGTTSVVMTPLKG